MNKQVLDNRKRSGVQPEMNKENKTFEELQKTCPHKHAGLCGDWFGGECEENNCHRIRGEEWQEKD